ncbi:MAG TPA: hypothetical protein VGP96_15140 [Candidatus Dormibacteraeota bacterium]|nr:hypothetical protein [Candidatus Dormibacteraeota bacterium]
MRTLRTVIAVGALATGLGLSAGGVHRAVAEAPGSTAWWSVAGVPGGGLPPPPDVQTGDLLVEGAAGGGASLPSAPALPAPLPPPPTAPSPPPAPALPPAVSTGGAPPGALAVAALSFPVAGGAQVGTLTLALGGVRPPSVSLIACPTTQPFHAVENGPLSDVPPFDCTVSDTAALTGDGAGIHFDHLEALVRGGGLSVVLLPGAADRVVLTRPGQAALAVVPAPPPPPDPPAPPAVPEPAAAPAPVAAAEPVIAPVAAPPARPHRRGVPRAALPAPAVAAPPAPVPRVLLVATLAGLGVAALLLCRPAAAAGTHGLHRFARARTGPAPRV